MVGDSVLVYLTAPPGYIQAVHPCFSCGDSSLSAVRRSAQPPFTPACLTQSCLVAFNCKEDGKGKRRRGVGRERGKERRKHGGLGMERGRGEGFQCFIYKIEIYNIDQLSMVTVIKKIQIIYTKI